MFNGGRPLSPEQQKLIDESLSAMQWLGGHGVKFEPIYSRQSFEKDGRHVFWGGLTLAAENEGLGLPPARAGSHRTDGPKAKHALTIKLDYSSGADRFDTHRLCRSEALHLRTRQAPWKGSFVRVIAVRTPSREERVGMSRKTLPCNG